MNGIKSQQGASFLKVFMVLAVLGAFGLAALQVLPLYYDKTVIAKILDDAAEEANKKRVGRKQMWKTISKHLQLNNIGYIKQDVISFEQGDNGETILGIDYEERRPLLGNLSLVVSFAHKTGR